MKLMVVAGGTGGHISPGISVYKILKSRGIDVFFVTNPKGLEFPIIKDNVKNEDLILLPISGGVSKSFFKNFKVIMEFFVSLFLSFKYVMLYNPNVIVLTGGYVSGPIGLAGWILGKKLVLLEQNSVMGLTNTFLSFFARKVILTFPLVNKKKLSDKYERIGNPVRYSESDILVKSYAKNTYGFSESDKVIGIILGSQGAKRVNEIILNGIDRLLESYKVLWITGQSYYNTVFEKCKNLNGVKVFPFLSNVNVFMSAIDVAISRSGASTLSELSFFGVPSVVIPFPYASRNHQYYNALFFESHGASLLIDESEFNIEKLLSALDFIFRNIDTFRLNAKKIFPSKLNDTVIDKILKD